MGDSAPSLPAFHLFHKASQRADNLFAETGVKLTPRQYIVLCVLERRDRASQTHLVQQTGIDRSTMTEVVKRLVAQGYLRRRRSPSDARAYDVRLTDKGREALKSAHEAAEHAVKQLFQFLPANSRTRFLDELRKLAGGG